MALIEEVCMGDVDSVAHRDTRAAYTPAPRNGRSAAELVMGAYPDLVIYPAVPQADALSLPGGGLGAQTAPPYQPASSPVAAYSGGENNSHYDHSSAPLRRSATWSSSYQRPAGSTWAERRRRLQMSRDVRRGQPKIVKKTTHPPASKAPTPAAWFPDPTWEDYAEFRTSGWVQNDKQVDDIAAMLAKW